MPQVTTETIAPQGSDGWIPDAATFGARLALIRQHEGWGNIAEAARACGISIETWRNWEATNAVPRDVLTVARQISDASGCNYVWLLGGSTPAASAA